MEKQIENKQALTNAKDEERRVRITTQEAIEYREYKRQKKRAEILSAVANSEGILLDCEDERKVRDNAMRLRQAAVCMSPERLQSLGEAYLQKGIAVDCIIGGNGETLAKVKAFEAKRAARLKARELSLVLSPYAVLNNRYEEIAKEIKLVKRAAPKLLLKVRVNRAYNPTILARLARISEGNGASYFCIPYHEGCERLKTELKKGCKLQVDGVDDLAVFKKMHGAGVQRIVTTQAWEMYSAWMKEVEKINFPELMSNAESVEIKQEIIKKKAVAAPLWLPIREPQKRLEASVKEVEPQAISVGGVK